MDLLLYAPYPKCAPGLHDFMSKECLYFGVVKFPCGSSSLMELCLGMTVPMKIHRFLFSIKKANFIALNRRTY